MENFNVEDYRAQLEKCEKINDCKKVPMIKDTDENYIFISYSRYDYKQVFSDLANFYNKGIYFWYDVKGISANDNWKTTVKKYLEDPKCSGVIFYLSPNFMKSENTYLEAEYASEIGKNSFCVNLTEEKSIRNIIFESAKSFGNDYMDRIEKLQKMFPNDNSYLNFSSVEHDNEIINSIEEKFDVSSSVTISSLETVYDELFFNIVDYYVGNNPIGLKELVYNLKDELSLDSYSPLSEAYNNANGERVVYSLLNQLQNLSIIQFKGNKEFEFLFDIYKWNNFKFEKFEKNRFSSANKKSFKHYNDNFINRMFSANNIISFANPHIYKNSFLEGCFVYSKDYGKGVIRNFNINGFVEIEYENETKPRKYDTKKALQSTYKPPFYIDYSDYYLSKIEILKSFNPKLECEMDSNCLYSFPQNNLSDFKYYEKESYHSVIDEDTFHVSKNGQIKPILSCKGNFYPCLKHSKCILGLDIQTKEHVEQYSGDHYITTYFDICVMDMIKGEKLYIWEYKKESYCFENKIILLLYENSGNDYLYKNFARYYFSIDEISKIHKNAKIKDFKELEGLEVSLADIYGALYISEDLLCLIDIVDSSVLHYIENKNTDGYVGSEGVFYIDIEKLSKKYRN